MPRPGDRFVADHEGLAFIDAQVDEGRHAAPVHHDRAAEDPASERAQAARYVLSGAALVPIRLLEAAVD